MVDITHVEIEKLYGEKHEKIFTLKFFLIKNVCIFVADYKVKHFNYSHYDLDRITPHLNISEAFFYLQFYI